MEKDPEKLLERRWNFVRAALAKEAPLVALCRQFGISRPTGYAWLRAFAKEGRAGLRDGRREPRPRPRSRARIRWTKAVLALRQRKRRWGPKKLRAALQRKHPRARLPSLRVLARVLREEGQVGPRRERTLPGRPVLTPPRAEADRPNRVWTIDFKGWFRTGDGHRCDPLTVRDLHSRYLLWLEHVPAQSDLAVRAVLERCFARYGLPQVVRVDNGAPFGSVGALGLSRLSVWWVRLGIQVEFTRPASPQDNGSHEQMHRELKAATACPAAVTLRAQARRFERFQKEYNHERPHEGVQLRCPADHYFRSRKTYRPVEPLVYPATAQVRTVKPGGRIRWEGRTRLIGRAFANEVVRLRLVLSKGSANATAAKTAKPVWEVFLGTCFLGELHGRDKGGMRIARLVRPEQHHAQKARLADAPFSPCARC